MRWRPEGPWSRSGKCMLCTRITQRYEMGIKEDKSLSMLSFSFFFFAGLRTPGEVPHREPEGGGRRGGCGEELRGRTLRERAKEAQSEFCLSTRSWHNFDQTFFCSGPARGEQDPLQRRDPSPHPGGQVQHAKRPLLRQEPPTDSGPEGEEKKLHFCHQNN